MAEESRNRIGRYEITAPLDAGGMGQVFRAWDPSLRRDVAVKLLRDEVAEDPARRQRLLEEARAAGSLNHPNIIAVYDVGIDEDAAFIVTELIDGTKLRQEVERGALATRRLLDLATQMAAGLSVAHEAGIAHRDLKPDNVMVTRDGRVKVVDFGLAKTYMSAPGGPSRPDAPTVTLPGSVVGTVAYMSPEQAVGGTLDFRTDQFSFGVMLFEMATGRHPFRRGSAPQTMTAIIEDDPLPVGELNGKVPVPLRWVIERCLAKDPLDRYASTADLFKDLSNLQTRFAEMTGDEPLRTSPSRARSSGVTIGALAGLVAGGLALALAPREEARTLRYTPLVTDSAFQSAPTWSPDGSTLAYVSTVDGVFQIFTRGLTTSQASSPLTNSRFDASDPFWSPDGSRIFYHSLAEEWESLWAIGAAGGAPSLAISNALGGTISPDGSTVAFFRERATGSTLFGLQRSLWLASPDGGNARAYSEAPFKGRTFVDGVIRFSPDGRSLLAWVWGWTGDNSNVPSSEFWVIPWPVGSPRRVLTSLTRAAPAAATFDWLPDSRRIVVSLWDEGTASTHLWIADIETGESRQITSTPGSESRPALSPDGRRLAFTDEAIDFDIVEIPLNGGQPRPLLATSRSEFDPTFSRDRSEYLYVSDKGGTLQIWRSSRDGRFVEPVVGSSQFPGDRTLALGSPALSPDGERVAYQRYTEKGGYQVWVSSIRGSGTPVLLAPGSFYQDAPTWSPDGQSVALVQRTRDLVASLAVVRLGTGSAPRLLVPNLVTLSARPKWSPDGRWILCDTSEGLAIVSPEGGAPRVISEDLWIALTWAADSRRVLGLREADDRTRHYALAALDIETGREEVLNPNLGIIPPALQPIRGLGLLGTNTLVTSVASARSDIYVVEDFEVRPSLAERLLFWR